MVVIKSLEGGGNREDVNQWIQTLSYKINKIWGSKA
jgi:hypothetical protein